MIDEKYKNVLKQCFRKEDVGEFVSTHRDHMWYLDLLSFVYFSYKPIEEKLKLYEEILDIEENIVCRNVYNFLKYCVERFDDNMNSIYMLNLYDNDYYEPIIPYNDKTSPECIDTEIFLSEEDALEYMKNNYELDNYGSSFIVQIKQYIREDNKLINTQDMYYIFMDGKFNKYLIDVSIDWANGLPLYNKYNEDIKQTKDEFVEYFEMIDIFDLFRAPEGYQFPFKNGDVLKLKTPTMEEPIFGRLFSEFDGARWYNFLKRRDDIDESYDLGYHVIHNNGIRNIFVALDWTEISTEEELNNYNKGEN